MLQWQFIWRYVILRITLHKSQVHCSGAMQWWDCSRSCPLLCLQGRVANLASGLFYCWSLLRNNITAINLRNFSSSYGRRRFSALVHKAPTAFFSNQICFVSRPGCQGRDEVRWRSGQEASLAPPYSNLRSFGSKCTFRNKRVIVIRRPGYCGPLPPLVTTKLGV